MLLPKFDMSSLNSVSMHSMAGNGQASHMERGPSTIDVFSARSVNPGHLTHRHEESRDSTLQPYTMALEDETLTYVLKNQFCSKPNCRTQAFAVSRHFRHFLDVESNHLVDAEDPAQDFPESSADQRDPNSVCRNRFLGSVLYFFCLRESSLSFLPLVLRFCVRMIDHRTHEGPHE